ncbi:hypothetical protein BMF94_6562 [Rhodotorula taiwanensis]|uniref:phosphatidylserine decarboxylase n=1 Tax=Rhodotorula taiwanensis TaxID=741276 RepID=A0A2S5B124_9BASI|nr:hypothetical protein BMF94_6562 [Rhodotorula taiwanensis]
MVKEAIKQLAQKVKPGDKADDLHPREINDGDFQTALDGLTHAPGEPPKDLDIHTPAEKGVKHSWLQRYVPGIEKLAAEYHVGNYVVTRDDPPNKFWESMPIYVRIGMQALYHGSEQSRLLAMPRVEEMLKAQSIKQGAAFDSPVNALAHIQSFIQTYQIDTSALLEPDIGKYKTFNEFFYRRLKPDARPPASPEDPDVVSSAADCRLTVFQSVDEAKKIWIKGHNFTIASLLEDAEQAKQYENGEIAVFRLAPADYHRYHSPVAGTVGKSKSIEGCYYTVNPVCVNENLDVFTKNKRDVTELVCPRPDGSTIPVAFVQVGAMLVGTIVRTQAEGAHVKRANELGYFGSTIIALFPPGKVQWDADLLKNSEQAMETVVKAGEQIGRFKA